MTAMLEVRDLEVAYGKIVAVKKISFSVEQGQVVSLIGTNGAGKTTTLRTISGLLRPTSGEILFQGERIEQVAAHDIVARGLAHSPEGRRIFPRLSVVVIEHDMRFIFNLCDRVLCLVRGEALIEGTPHEVQSDPRVIEAYIGTGEEDDEDVDVQDTTIADEETP